MLTINVRRLTISRLTKFLTFRRKVVFMEKEQQRSVSFSLRVLHNLIKDVIAKSSPKFEVHPQSQLQGGILGFLYHSQDPVYQKDIEKVFRISRATATNTLQVMEKNGMILRKSEDKDARLKRVYMTDQARANHTEVEKHMHMMDSRMLAGLSEEDRERLGAYLEIIMKNLCELREEVSHTSDESDSE